MFENNLIPSMNWPFVRELAAETPPFFFGKKNGRGKSVFFRKNFPDPEKRLDTVYRDLARYFEAAGYGNKKEGFSFRTRFRKTDCFEEYQIEISTDDCIISAGDTEGIRRGLYAFEDLLLAKEGAWPEPQTIIRRPWLKTRLGRCPFSPVKRWPVNTDELLDDIDYYPDAYLNRLAHDAVNGSWLVCSLRELGISSFTEEDPQRRKRLEKLSAVAEKCRRYGIRIYLFMIEPFGMPAGDPLLKAHPEMSGPPAWGGKTTFCPHSPATRQYLREMFSSLFREVPALGGVINITHGERPTTCVSTVGQGSDAQVVCSSKCGLSNGEIINLCLEAMFDGIRSASSDAELIAWFYFPDPEKLSEWASKIADAVPDGVIPQFNFESGGKKMQLGRTHTGNDYWVSYTGPSERFVRAAERRRGISAKLQLGCGHELATVPYIPAPGQAYRKYRAMHKLGVGHVMHSWYVGNFPGLMSRAMGLLAFEEFKDSEEDFLRRLAAPEWGATSRQAVKAWLAFGTAYRSFPFSIMFQYYGPQNAMPMWKFHFMPDLDPLGPPWKPNYPLGGDTVGEALSGFTIGETEELVRKMADGWRKGLSHLLPLRKIFAKNRDRIRDIDIAVTLGILLDGSLNLLRFYSLREKLFLGKKSVLSEMVDILHSQKRLLEQLAPLLDADSRLGFHGEALTRIFDGDKTREAIAELDHSFEEARKLAGAPSPLALAVEEGSIRIAESRTFLPFGDNGRWRYSVSGKKLKIEMRLPVSMDAPFSVRAYFIDFCGVRFPLTETFTHEKGKIVYQGNTLGKVTGFVSPSHVTTQYSKGLLTLTWPISELPHAKGAPFLRCNLLFADAEKNVYASGNGYPGRLLLGSFNPHDAVCLKLGKTKEK